jgi:hypothetical protein
MANYVKISVTGARSYSAIDDVKLEDVFRGTIKHWKDELDRLLPNEPDLIILPECCDHPRDLSESLRPDLYPARGNRIFDFFSGVAKDHNCYIAYATIRELEDGSRNSIIIIDRQGKIAGIYNKNHVVPPPPGVKERTQEGLCGKDAPLIECDFGRVGCAICYDLNFNELRLKYVESRPDLLIFSSAYHGGLMQNYWAYSCRAHFASSVSDLPCSIISPVGQLIGCSTSYFHYTTTTVNLDCCIAHLDYNWDHLRAMKKKYGTKVTITDPSYLGSVLISSETQGLTAKDMAREFEIELLDDYMARALEHRRNHIEP